MIIPAILENSILKVQTKLNKIAGLVDRIQIDVVDGVFADNLTVSPVDLLNINFHGLKIDAHLMTEEPMDFLPECSDLAAKSVGVRVIGQIERMGNQAEFISLARELKLAVGLALDFYTPVDAIDKKIALSLDCILLMAVKAGTQGNEKFSATVVNKIMEIKKGPAFRRQAGPLQIIVDGGLSPENIKICKQAGAAEFAVGSYLWQHADIKQALYELNLAADIM